MRPRSLSLLAFSCLAPLPAGAAEGSGGILGRAAWFVGAWVIFSFAATAVVAVWFRARARANERLSARIRREDWLAASGAEPAASREPVE